MFSNISEGTDFLLQGVTENLCEILENISLYCLISLANFLLKEKSARTWHDYAQASQAQNTWCIRQLVYAENCMGKLPIEQKLCE